MKKTCVRLLMVAALCLPPATSWAQGEAPEDDTVVDDTAAEGAATDELPGDELPGDELPGDIPGGEGLEDICEIDPEACPQLDMEKEAQRDLPEEIYAVQQVFVLKGGRFELQPYWSITLNDQFVSHPAPGIAINYYITNVLAVGANFNYYRPFNVEREFNAQVRRSARVAVPLTEYDWGAAANFSYVPAIGKFSGFGDFIFQYEAYIVGGVGALSTRPIAVIEPDNRNFEFEPRLAFNAGIGLRIFITRWLAATLEVRDYIFIDQLEALTIAEDPIAQQDPDTWLGEKKLTNNVQAQIGVSIFLPFSFEYKLPR